MTQIKNLFSKYLLMFLMIVSLVLVAACGDDSGDEGGNEGGGEDNPPVEIVEISMTASANTIKKGETVTLNVTVKGTTNTAYTVSVSDPSLLAVNDNQVSVLKDITLDQIVSITATATADTTKTASVSLTVKAPIIEGQVGELTSAMLAEIGNANITISGTLTDYYQNFNQSIYNSADVYEMTVKMSDGAWAGSWNVKGNAGNAIVDNYRRGKTDGIKDQYGNVGHALEKLIINKDNEVEAKTVKDYMSVPAVWEGQHLWNHLANLNINKFEYDAENKVYSYKIDANNMDDLYLMTYLSYSLTPMLEDTLMGLYLVVENGHVTKLLGQTEVLYYGSDTQEEADAMSYTVIEVEFSNIGTTVVPEPTPFAAPEYSDLLKAALDKMASAKNYTFQTVDTTTYAPSTDGGEYEIQSAPKSSSTMSLLSTKPSVILPAVHNHVSSVGTVGRIGQITEDAVLFADTGKYSYSMDGKDYHISYSGYKQNTDGTYDEFEYNTTEHVLYGTKKVTGSFFDKLPTFDFSANIFSFAGMGVTKEGKKTYTFKLQETAITRDVAMEVCCHSYADDADASTQTPLTIVVDEDGNLLQTVFPYSLVSGTYMGYCTTTYLEVGTTTLPDDLFEGYIPRKVKASWSDYVTKYYSANFSTLDSHDEDTSVVLEAVYGEAAKDIPAPTVFMEILGDNISGPFYNWKEKGTDAEGNPINTGYININVATSEYDENHRITNYEELMAELGAALEKEGFTLSIANTDTTGGESGMADRYVCYIKGDIQIVIQNNHTKFLWIYFYKTGDWTLRR